MKFPAIHAAILLFSAVLACKQNAQSMETSATINKAKAQCNFNDFVGEYKVTKCIGKHGPYLSNDLTNVFIEKDGDSIIATYASASPNVGAILLLHNPDPYDGKTKIDITNGGCTLEAVNRKLAWWKPPFYRKESTILELKPGGSEIAVIDNHYSGFGENINDNVVYSCSFRRQK